MIIRLMGGMGNQMFQYAMGKALALKWHEEVYFDDSSYADDKLRTFAMGLFNVDINIAPQSELEKYRRIRMLFYKIRRHVKISRIAGYQREKREYGYDRYRRAGYLEGYWQNEKYFLPIKETLRQEFVYTGELTLQQEQIIYDMRQENSVAVHVRHGDYLSPKNRNTYICLPLSYYQQAIFYLEEQLENLTIYVFSDDMDWCKQQFQFTQNVVFIDESISNSAQIDFELMRNCKHFVIANSTFSWWPAWLAANHDKIVIAPKAWFYDEGDNQAVRQGLNSEFNLI